MTAAVFLMVLLMVLPFAVLTASDVPNVANACVLTL